MHHLTSVTAVPAIPTTPSVVEPVIVRSATAVPGLRPPAPAAAVEPPAAACPAWCANPHGNGIDVEHESAHALLAAPAGGRVEVIGQLLQEPGQDPRLVLAICDGVEADGVATLTLDDAEQAVARLQALISAARLGAESR
ncbi:hypothetical protein Ppa06_26180 [Planomonospora parontospora subsp. parontospora]|uniref:Uncharacterized protein n=2 Tax=Planomonospora parontospora TaxID=58119 RepID=A0AA37BEV1_9ACTN|nr:hypothetical protein [Planomonospora parontospora]GGK60049.1 hypothetical protein GCM10010126_19500 [Planomonospora parontospora]GII08820.1 hypothetical protein Ppa06_26180 [Planomonospora parontospora subsp. parontospora]